MKIFPLFKLVNMRKYWFFLFFALVWTSATAQESRGFKPVNININGVVTPLYSGSHALLIGVSRYTDWPDLPGVKNDLAAVKQVLEAQGFAVQTVLDPNGEQLRQAYENFIDSYGMDLNNRLLFYFAGHGHTIKSSYGDEMGYIVPADAPLPGKNRRGFMKDALSMQQMDVYARTIQSKHALFMFDACFSGALFALSRAVPEVISYKTTQHVRQFITSGAADEEVPDHSIFRSQFVEALTTTIADGNNDGFLTGTELGEYLQSSVVNYSYNGQHPQYGKIRHPSLDKGDFVFVLKNPEAGGHKTGEPVTEQRGQAVETTTTQYFGAIQVTSRLEGDLYLDGKKTQYLTPGAVAMLKNLPAGQHELRIDGDETWMQLVDVTRGQTAEVTARSRKNLKVENQWILVEGDTYKMGSANGDPAAGPEHRVKVSDFAIQQHEVTNAEYAGFMQLYGTDKVKDGPWAGESMVTPHRTGLQETGSGWQAQPGFEQHPVINITWFGADAYCRFIGGRLPTEAEWEFAATGGRTSKGDITAYAGSHEPAGVAWTYENANNTPNRVMTKNPNSLDIYDMSGNVWEWCSDWYDDDYYKTCDRDGKVSDPQGPAAGIYRVIRGGSWSYKNRFATTTTRNKTHPGATYYDVGFRCVKRAGK